MRVLGAGVLEHGAVRGRRGRAGGAGAAGQGEDGGAGAAGQGDAGQGAAGASGAAGGAGAAGSVPARRASTQDAGAGDSGSAGDAAATDGGADAQLPPECDGTTVTTTDHDWCSHTYGLARYFTHAPVDPSICALVCDSAWPETLRALYCCPTGG